MNIASTDNEKMWLRFRCDDGDVVIPKDSFANILALDKDYTRPIKITNTTIDQLCDAFHYVSNAYDDAEYVDWPIDSIESILALLGFDDIRNISDKAAEYVSGYTTYYAYRNRVSYVAHMMEHNGPRIDTGSIAAAAAAGAAIDVIEFLANKGYRFESFALEAGARNGNVAIFRYMMRHKSIAPLTFRIGSIASYYGYVNILRIYHQNGGILDPCFVDDATTYGYTSMMRYLIQNRIDAEYSSYIRAIANGYNRLLKILIARCAIPLRKGMTKCALQCNNYKALRLLIKAGCPLSKNAIRFIKANPNCAC